MPADPVSLPSHPDIMPLIKHIVKHAVYTSKLPLFAVHPVARSSKPLHLEMKGMRMRV